MVELQFGDMESKHKVVSVHTKKAQGGIETKLHVFLTLSLHGGVQSVSRSCYLIPRGNPAVPIEQETWRALQLTWMLWEQGKVSFFAGN